jgi:hypothetical protein
MYQQESACKCRYIGSLQVSMCMSMYAEVYHLYLHVLQVLDHWGMETTTTSPKHPLVTQHPAGPTQSTPLHVPIHFTLSSQSHLTSLTTLFFCFWKSQCLDLSCHGHRNGQDPLEGQKHGLVALTQALYRTQSRVLRSDV